MFPICSDTERFLVKVTPSIFRLSTLMVVTTITEEDKCDVYA